MRRLGLIDTFTLSISTVFSKLSITIPLLIVNILGGVLFGVIAFFLLGSFTLTLQFPTITTTHIVVFGVIAFILVVLNVVAAGCVVGMVKVGIVRADTSLGEGFSEAMDNFSSLIALGIFFSLFFVIIYGGGLYVIRNFITSTTSKMVLGLVLPILLMVISFLLIYVIPAIVIDRFSFFDSIFESISVVFSNLFDTLLLIFGMIVLGILFGIVGAIVGMIPIVGGIFSILISIFLGTVFLIATTITYVDVR